MPYQSMGLRDFLNQFGSLRLALLNGTLDFYEGSMPTIDSSLTGDLIVRLTNGGGAITREVRSAGSVTLSGTESGSIDTLTVNSVSIINAAVPFNTSLAQTATDLCNAINRCVSSPRYQALVSGTKVTITAMPGTGTTPNGYVVACGATTVTATPVNMGTEVAGVAAVNGLKLGNNAIGVISKLSTDTWSGTVLLAGTVGYAVFTGSVADAGGASTTAIRLYLTVGLSGSGADIEMATTTLVAGTQHTQSTLNLTMPQ